MVCKNCKFRISVYCTKICINIRHVKINGDSAKVYIIEEMKENGVNCKIMAAVEDNFSCIFFEPKTEVPILNEVTIKK